MATVVSFLRCSTPSATWVAKHCGLFVAFCTSLYWLIPSFRVGNHDAQNLYYTAARIFEWRPSALEEVTLSPLHGMGAAFLPLNPTFIPFLWPFAIFAGVGVRVFLVTLSAALTIFLASWFFFSRLGLKSSIALGSAWMTYVVAMLGTGEYLTGTDPLICTVFNLVCLGALNSVGVSARAIAGSICWGTIYVLGFVLLILAHPVWHLMGLPFLLTFATVIAIASQRWRECLMKCGAVVAGLAIAWILGAYEFLSLLLSDTARLMLASKFSAFDHTPFLAGHMFRSAATDILWSGLVIIGLGGSGLLGIADRHRLWHAVSIASSASYVVAAIGGLAFLLSVGSWPWPKPSYVLLSFYPIGALFSVVGIRLIYFAITDANSFRWAACQSPRRLTAIGICLTAFLLWHAFYDPIDARAVLIAATGLALVAAMLWRKHVRVAAFVAALGALVALESHATDLMRGRGADRDGPTRMAIKENPVVAFLAGRVGLTPGALFRGYVDDAYRHIEGMTLGGDLITQWSGNWQLYGNGMKLFTWNALGIPTLSIYSPYIKPLYFIFFTGLLNNAGEQQEVNYLTISRPDIRSLELAGVRYLVKDDDTSPGQDARLVASWEKFQVYELPNPNLGSYTPTEAVTVVSADDAIAHLRDPAFDPTRRVLVDDAGPIGSLVASAPAEIVFERGGFHVTAMSTGRTLVVLPIQFTHCLVGIRTDGLPDMARLIRVNIAQTGLLFEGRVSMSVRYRDWPRASLKCRRLDYQDSVSLVGVDRR